MKAFWNIKSKNKSSAIIFGFCLILVITSLRTLRLPNDWAEGHWLLNYDYGFIKRLLPGTIFKPLIYSNGASNAEFYISLISSFILFVFYSVLIYICIQVAKKNEFSISSVLIIILFLTSPYIVMSAHLIGYTDNILIISSIIAMWLVIRKHIWTASVIIFITVFIHENILLIGLPSVICIIYFQHLKEKNPTNNPVKRFLITYSPLFLLPLLASIIILFNQILYVNEGLEKQFVNHLSKFDFIEEDRNYLVPEELTKSYSVYLEAESPKFFRRITSPLNIIRNILPLIFILIFTRRFIKSTGISKSFIIVVLAVVFLPLTLHLIAWDTPRIWTYPIMTSILILWGLLVSFSHVDVKIDESLPFIVLSIVIIIFNLFIHTPLMDEEYERFSNELRILMYFPPLSLILVSILKNYTIKKVR